MGEGCRVVDARTVVMGGIDEFIGMGEADGEQSSAFKVAATASRRAISKAVCITLLMAVS